MKFLRNYFSIKHYHLNQSLLCAIRKSSIWIKLGMVRCFMTIKIKWPHRQQIRNVLEVSKSPKMKQVKLDHGKQASLMIVHPSHTANLAVEDYLFFKYHSVTFPKSWSFFVYLSSPLRFHFWKEFYTSEEHDFNFYRFLLVVPFGLFVCKNVYLAHLIFTAGLAV